ncbi:MAG TPA: acetyl ornithine aminotransferase family protein [Elusimicrobia bacterium]|nr:aspartate aminotransferase family protein [Elusimicrobiota bacterium]HBT62180.1 acetyl ornithine aminotransferase family protein [Elusimicrobiota bacterium]
MPPKTAAVRTDYPRILVPPPGPRAKKIIALDRAWTSPSYIKEYPLVVATGKGAMLEDVDGNRFIDWMAGIAVSATGYNHPKINSAIHEAADKFLHICGTDFYYEALARLCERLARCAPGNEKYRVFLTNSGTEAVEGAVKLARYHTKRPHLIAFEGAFHGRSYAAVTLTCSKVKYKAGFGPMLPEVSHLPFDNPYRGGDALAAARRLFETKVSPKDVAAVFMEPIQGEGGYIMPRPEFVKAWRQICDEHGILLVFDEIQSGVGRTGKMWACEHYNVEPDILLCAKGLGSGLPIGAIVAKERVMTWGQGTHGTTFGGNPVCCAAALATLDVVEKELCDNAAKMGERLLAGLRRLQSEHACIGDVRGVGLMIGVEFIKDAKTKEPDAELVARLEALAFGKGLLLLSCGKAVIRVAPPLVLNPYDVDTGLDILDDCLTELGR